MRTHSPVLTREIEAECVSHLATDSLLKPKQREICRHTMAMRRLRQVYLRAILYTSRYKNSSIDFIPTAQFRLNKNGYLSQTLVFLAGAELKKINSCKKRFN